jgi:hypothetical protein
VIAPLLLFLSHESDPVLIAFSVVLVHLHIATFKIRTHTTSKYTRPEWCATPEKTSRSSRDTSEILRVCVCVREREREREKADAYEVPRDRCDKTNQTKQVYTCVRFTNIWTMHLRHVPRQVFVEEEHSPQGMTSCIARDSHRLRSSWLGPGC